MKYCTILEQLIDNSKEVIGVSNVDPKVLGLINRLTARLLELEVKMKTKNDAFIARQRAGAERHNKQVAPLQRTIERIREQIAKLVKKHEASLIEPDRRSFATMIATFQFRTMPSKLKVTDVEGLMEAARELGIVRKIATQTVVWKLDRAKLIKLLERDGELRMQLDEYLEEPSGESLTIKPNESHVVVYDGKRISPPSIKINPS